jgi:sugar-specific transcriptional regulator TrmB
MVKDRDLTNMFAQLFSESKLSLAIAKDEMLEDFYESKEAFLAAYKESLRELILNPPRKVFAHSTVNESELIAGSKYTLFCDEANRWFWLSDDLNLYSTNKGKFQLI